MQVIHDAFHRGFSPRARVEPAEWASKNVILPRSTDSAYFRPEFTPWWPEIMREGASNRNSIITILAPIGSGKSTFIEAMNCYCLARSRGQP